MSSLFEAVRHGDQEAFEQLVARGSGRDAEGGSHSPLYEALGLGRIGMAKRLVEAGADVNRESATAMRRSVSRWRQEMSLLPSGSSLGART